jgi:biopolymer transport protein ExbD
MLKATILLLLLAPIGAAQAQQKPIQPVLKVAVMADGRITVDGKPAMIESLRGSLKKLSLEKGVV